MSHQNIALGGLSVTGAMIGGLADQRSHRFQGLDIRVSPANGGWIISIHPSTYSVGYAVEPDLYVVHEDQDIGTELGKIITMHCLKKENK